MPLSARDGPGAPGGPPRAEPGAGSAGRGAAGAALTRPPERSCPPGTRPSTRSALTDNPVHVARFGTEFHADGVLAGSKDAKRCIWYLTKYLTKQISGCHTADTDAQRAHADRPWTPCGTSRARRTARTGCATASSPKVPAKACGPAVQGQGLPGRQPRVCGPPGPGLAQVVGQDPRRSPRRPQGLAPGDARPARPRRRRPLPLGGGLPWRCGLHDPRQADAVRPVRPSTMAGRAR